jgi:hypothetical protein
LHPKYDHLVSFWKSTQVDSNFGFQVGICIALSKSYHWKKYFFILSNFPQYPKFDEPSIQQQEIVLHEPSTILVDHCARLCF